MLINIKKMISFLNKYYGNGKKNRWLLVAFYGKNVF